MSVINKVLRDLDKRQVATPMAQSPADAALRNGTSSVEALASAPLRAARKPPKPMARMAWVGVLLALAGLGGGVWKAGILDGMLNTATGPAATSQSPPPAAPATVAAAAAEPAAAVLEVPTIELVPASRFESTLALPATLQSDPAKPQKTEPLPRAQAAVAPAPPPAASPAVAAAAHRRDLRPIS